MKILFIDTVHPYLWNSLQEAGHECVEGYVVKGWINATGFILWWTCYSQSDSAWQGNPFCCCQTSFYCKAGAGMESIDVECAQSKTLHAWTPGRQSWCSGWACSRDVTVINRITWIKPTRKCEWLLGTWGQSWTWIRRKTVGIMGYGNMGDSVLFQNSKAFPVVVCFMINTSQDFGDGVEEVSLKLCKHIRYFNLHIPLTAETDGWIDYKFISSFKKKHLFT